MRLSSPEGSDDDDNLLSSTAQIDQLNQSKRKKSDSNTEDKVPSKSSCVFPISKPIKKNCATLPIYPFIIPVV